MRIDLREKVALITGATAGIGAGTATVFARAGADLVLAGRDEARLRAVQGQAVKLGVSASIVTADVTTNAGLEKIIDHVRAHHEELHVVVNNVGTSLPTPLDASDEFWDNAFALDFTAARKLTQAFLPEMIERRWGRVVNVSGSMEPRSLNAASVAKGALHLWSKGLSCDVAKAGVTVNCVAPGRITSDQTMIRLHPDPEARQAFIDANIPIGHFGSGEDMGNMIAFLSSDLATYVTGAVIPVDGGMHAFAH